jgi:hypothetical protein
MNLDFAFDLAQDGGERRDAAIDTQKKQTQIA